MPAGESQVEAVVPGVGASTGAGASASASADQPEAASTVSDSSSTGPIYYSVNAIPSGEKPFTTGAAEASSSTASSKGDAASKVAAAAAAVAKAAKAGANASDTATVHASPLPTLPNPTTEEFIASIGEQARQIAQDNGLYASVMIAQAILESGSGSSGLSKPPYNNLFGIKGTYKGAAAYMLTSEDDGTGRRYDIMAAFRSYPSTRESLQDYADLLTKSMGAFYAPAWKANAATYADACDYLQHFKRLYDIILCAAGEPPKL